MVAETGINPLSKLLSKVLALQENSKKCLILSGQVQQRYLEDGNDKLKLLMLLCGEDDEKLQIAAAGGLAMITAAEKKLCVKMTKVVCMTVTV